MAEACLAFSSDARWLLVAGCQPLEKSGSDIEKIHLDTAPIFLGDISNVSHETMGNLLHDRLLFSADRFPCAPLMARRISPARLSSPSFQ